MSNAHNKTLLIYDCFKFLMEKPTRRSLGIRAIFKERALCITDKVSTFSFS